MAYNSAHGITPRTIEKSVEDIMRSTAVADAIQAGAQDDLASLMAAVDQEGPEALIARLEGEMLEAAKALQFERAASLRDRIDEIRQTLAAAGQAGLPGVAAGVGAGETPGHGPGAPEPRRRPHRFGGDR